MSASSPEGAPVNWSFSNRIGSGGYGQVYKCHDKDSGRLLAVKVVSVQFSLDRASEELLSLQSEIRIYETLRHPRIVRYYGYQRYDDGSLAIFMEFMSGGSVQDQIKEFGVLTETLTRRYTRQVLEGLRYLHRKGIIHIDIKGANILRDNEGKVKLCDFGISKQLQTIMHAKTQLGTLHYMSPEILRGECYGCSTDIWSLGCTVVEMLTGKPPWHKLGLEAAYQICTSDKPEYQLPDDVSDVARNFLTRSFIRDQHQRPSAIELLRDPFVTEAAAAYETDDETDDDRSPTPALDRAVGVVLHTLPEGETVCGITSLDNLLYVLRGRASSQQLEVYDKDSFRLQRFLIIPRLVYGWHITACARNRCAYICDISNNYMRRVGLPLGTDVTQWPINDTPARLSVTDTHSVLVTCGVVRKIKEFSTSGELLRQIQLAEELKSPRHVIQLSSGEFVVCHGYSTDRINRVCLIDSDGHVLKSYGGPQGSDTQQMNSPTDLAVDGNGFVFVSDLNNKRVLLPSPALTFEREVLSQEQLQWRPVRLWLDSDRHGTYMLYVGVDHVVQGGVHRAGKVVVFSCYPPSDIGAIPRTLNLGVWSCAPSGVQRQSPWSGRRGQSLLKLTAL